MYMYIHLNFKEREREGKREQRKEEERLLSWPKLALKECTHTEADNVNSGCVARQQPLECCHTTT